MRVAGSAYPADPAVLQDHAIGNALQPIAVFAQDNG